MSKDILIVTDTFTADELCDRLHIEAVTLHEYISYEIVTPRGQHHAEWIFDMQQVERLRKALRLQRDFEINKEGVVLVLQLLDELDMLRAESDLLHQHILK